MAGALHSQLLFAEANNLHASCPGAAFVLSH